MVVLNIVPGFVGGSVNGWSFIIYKIFKGDGGCYTETIATEDMFATRKEAEKEQKLRVAALREKYGLTNASKTAQEAPQSTIRKFQTRY